MAISEEVLDGTPPYGGAVGHVQVLHDQDLTLVVLSGEVDLALQADLHRALAAAIGRALPVRVDARALTFIDSIGMNFLARLFAAGAEQGGRLPVVGANRGVREALTLVGLGPIVDLIAE